VILSWAFVDLEEILVDIKQYWWLVQGCLEESEEKQYSFVISEVGLPAKGFYHRVINSSLLLVFRSVTMGSNEWSIDA
jgi:hypothetical protein